MMEITGTPSLIDLHERIVEIRSLTEAVNMAGADLSQASEARAIQALSAVIIRRLKRAAEVVDALRAQEAAR